MKQVEKQCWRKLYEKLEQHRILYQSWDGKDINTERELSQLYDEVELLRMDLEEDDELKIM